MIDHLNRIWIGTDGKGLVLYDIEKNEAQHFSYNLDNQSKLSSNAIYSVYEDQTGMYWIGTYLMGLNKYDPDKISFGSYHYSSSSKNGISHNIVTGFCEDKNNRIWISTDGGGINIFNREKDQFSYYKHEKGNPASLSTNTTMSLFRDSDYNIWVATFIGGINKFDWETQKFVHYFHDPDDSTSLISNSPWSYAQDKMKNIWIGTVDLGLDLLKNGSNTFVHYQTTIANHYGPDQLNSRNITQLFIDKSNRLWIGTEYGLDMVDLNLVDFSQPVPELYFNHYMPDSSENSISYNRISYINEDNNNNIWIGTKGRGLNKLDLSTNMFTTYTMKDGLPHNIINGILFDSDNNPWISTSNGLSYFNVKTGKFKNFYASDGLQSSVFIKTSCFKASDGMFFFGGTNGFNCFYPDKIISKGKTLKTVLTDFKLFNQSVTIGEKINNRIVLNKAIYELDEINLFYKENNISFEFSALDYSKPEKIFYSYILEGFDKGWQVADANMRIAKYTNLSPGKYIFKVKATLNEDKWPETATSIRINIHPPWWMKWWFRISVVFFVLAIITLIFLLRVRSLHKQKKVLESTVVERTKQLKEANDKKDKFLAILAHDLINPFSTILGFTDLLLTNFSEWDEKAKLETIKTINDSSSDLYQLLLNLLEWSRSERGLIEYSPEKIDLNNCINNVLSLQSAMAQSKQITLEKNFQESNYYVKSDVQLLNAILRNLISNAIKFTQKGGKISVQLEPDENYLTVSITDNGVGMKKQKLENLFRIDIQQSTLGTNQEKGTGIGLLLVKEFVTKQHGLLNVESKLGKGSTFSFTIPRWSD